MGTPPEPADGGEQLGIVGNPWPALFSIPGTCETTRAVNSDLKRNCPEDADCHMIIEWASALVPPAPFLIGRLVTEGLVEILKVKKELAWSALANPKLSPKLQLKRGRPLRRGLGKGLEGLDGF